MYIYLSQVIYIKTSFNHDHLSGPSKDIMRMHISLSLFALPLDTVRAGRIDTT